MQFRVREVKPEAVRRPTPTIVSASKLNQKETDSILKQLPPMPVEAEKSDFKLRTDSLPPPKTGTIIEAKFPADQNQFAPSAPTSKTLEVVRFTPQNNVPLVSELSLTFSQPMIAVTSPAQASENVPVQLTPAVKGKWRWIGTKTLIFDAEKRFPMATKYTVTIPAGTKSAVGGSLPKEVSWEFSTPPPKVENFEGNNRTLRRDEIILASFDQEIDPSSVLTKISATSNGQRILLRLATESEMAANEEVSKATKEIPQNHWIAFRAAELLPPDSLVNFSFEKGLPSAEGNLTTNEAQNFSFRTFGNLKFIKASCSYDENIKICPPTSGWRFEFNNPLDAKSFDKSNIKIEPQIDNFSFYIYDNQLSIVAAKKPRTTYQVTISGVLKDEFGQNLGADVSTKFTIGAIGASLLDLSGYKNFVTLDPNARPTYSVPSINYQTLKVRIYTVKPEDYPAFLAFRDYDKAIFPTFGKLVFNQMVKVKNKPDESVVTNIDLAPALTKGFGHAVLIVEPPGTKNRYGKMVKWLQASQIGLDAFADHEQIAVFTSNLKDGKPLSKVQLSLSNGVTSASGENGIANLKLPVRKDKKKVFLVARNGDDSAILTNDYYDDDYDTGAVGWFATEQKDTLRWFVFDDRKMYRPGETVSIKGYVRKLTGGKLSDVSELADAASGVSYVLKDAQEVELAKGVAKLNAFGAFDLQLKIPAKVNLGEQSLQLKAVSLLGAKEFTHSFQVQEFRRPEFEVSARVESAAPFYLGDSATIVTEAKYYSGGGLANAQTNWDLSATPTNYTPPNRDDFTFGKFIPWWRYSYENNWALRTREEFKGTTDIEGKHRIALDFLKADPARPYKIEAEAEVQDVNRQTFSGSTTLLVHPAKLYVGLRTPKTFVQARESFKVETITTDIDGQSVSGAPVTVTAELKDWQQVKGEWKEVVLDAQKCEVKSANEVVWCYFTAKQGGTYTVTASVWDEKERRNESELTVWVAGGTTEKSRNVEGAELELIPDKKEYAPNETAEILLNAPFYPAEGVLTLERNGIIKTERLSLEKSSTVVQIPIEESYLPNVHLGITLVGTVPLEIYSDERDAKLPKRPAYATGELNLDISTASRKLKVTAEPLDKTLAPGGKTKINVAVKDNNGNAVANSEVAIVAVDDSILALTGYKIDNPLDVFYEKLEANVSSSHSREDILLESDLVRGDNIAGLLGGGGGGYAANATNTVAYGKSSAANTAISANTAANVSATPASVMMDKMVNPKLSDRIITRIDESPADQNNSLQMMQLRRNFAALAIFAPSVKTDANGKATVDVQLPDNLTRYRITAVAVTQSKQFGLGESNMTAKQPLQVRPSAPRFMNFGDKIELPVVLQNQTDSPMTIEVAIRSSNAVVSDGHGRRVTVPAHDRAEIRFPVTAENAGIARFQIGATSGKFADAAEIEFPVYTPATSEAFATYGSTDTNGALIQPILAPQDVYSEFGGLEITSSSTQLQELTDAFIYLQNYPFECSEQISSRMLSVAALRDVLKAFNAKDMPTQAQIEAKMKSDLERLQKLQHADGGFSFWRNDDESFPFVTVHAAHALARAKAKGYAVPKETIAKTLGYLKAIEAKMAKLKYSQESMWAISAYALLARDLLGDKDATKAKKLLQEATLEKLSPESIGWILSVLANDKTSTVQVETIKRHLLNRVTETAGNAHFVSNYKDGEYVLLSSQRRADGVILEALLQASSLKSQASSPELEALIPKIVRGLLANKTKGHWASTQENAFVLLALDKYFQTFEKATPNFIAKVWLGSGFAGEQKFVGRTTASGLINVPMSYLQTQKGEQNLTLDKQGEGRLYYRLGLKYAPKNLTLAAADDGFEVTRKYEAIDQADDVKQNSDGSWTIRAGSRIRVKIQMVNPVNRYHVALVDYLPAGIEIINPDLAVSSKTDDELLMRPVDRNFGSWFEHQNLRDDRAEAFRSFLNAGVWSYSYVARATTLGEFVTPPARAEEMYSPETFGRSRTDFVKVE